MRAAFFKLHLSILIAGLTGVFGRLISLSEGPLVWYRLLITSVLFYWYLRLRGHLPRLPLREFIRIGAIGALLAVHWIFFYGSIKYANVSIGVICYSLAGFFTAVFDPLISRRRFSFRELLYSLITVCGIMLIFHLDIRHRTGIVLGIISAALAALFMIFNKRIGGRHAPTTTLFYEMLGGFLALSLMAPVFLLLYPDSALIPSGRDFLYLLLLSSLCTIVLYLLQLQALQKISAFTVNLSYNLEPVYSILIAMAFLGEASEVNFSFYVGLGLICLSVLLQTASAIRNKTPPPSVSSSQKIIQTE